MFGAKRRPKRTQKRDRKNDAEKRRKRSPKPAPKTNAQTSPKPRPRTPTQPAPPSPSQRTKPQPKPNPKNPGPRSRKRRRTRPAQRAQKIGLKPPEEKRKSQRRARHSPQKRASPARRARAARQREALRDKLLLSGRLRPRRRVGGGGGEQEADGAPALLAPALGWKRRGHGVHAVHLGREGARRSIGTPSRGGRSNWDAVVGAAHQHLGGALRPLRPLALAPVLVPHLDLRGDGRGAAVNQVAEDAAVAPATPQRVFGHGRAPHLPRVHPELLCEPVPQLNRRVLRNLRRARIRVRIRRGEGRKYSAHGGRARHGPGERRAPRSRAVRPMATSGRPS